MIHPLKGSGQVLSVFEKKVGYITTDNVEADDDGYVRSGRENKRDIRAVVVAPDADEYDLSYYGENYTAVTNVIIRDEQRFCELSVSTGNYFVIDDVEWKIIRIDDYDTVYICLCGKSEVGGYPVV